MPVRKQTAPAATIDNRHADGIGVTRGHTKPANTSGMIICVTPPPRFPQPADVALAVPTQFGANITDV